MPEIRHFSLDTDAQTLAGAVKEDGAACKMCCLPNFFCNPSNTIMALELLSDQSTIALLNKA